MTYPDFSYEIPLWEQGYLVLGIDEVGRGAFAGPLGVGGVVFPEFKVQNSDFRIEEMGINDSKKVSEKKRNELAERIPEVALFAESVFIHADEINTIGITKAFEKGVQLLVDDAIEKLPNRTIYLLIDGNFNLNINGIKDTHKMNIIKGDSRSLSIAAASIVAKVARDNYMKSVAADYPEYGFESHVGYGTTVHRAALQAHGACDLHRTDYIKNWIGSNS